MGSEERSQAILYAAKSTEDKRGSIEGQLQEGRDFARRESLEVIAEYSEEDVSAYRGNRGPELAAALQHAERIGGVLIAQHSDRLARGDGRQARHLVEIALWARKTGVEVRCIQDPTTFENLALAAVMGERNMEDSRRKSAAVAAGIARRRSSGRAVGPPSYGFTWRRNKDDERELIADPEQAPIVKRIYREYLAGRAQLQIARGLNAEGVPTLRGGRWKPEVIRSILTNPIYAGLIRDGQALIRARHKPIIARRRWEAAQAKRKGSKGAPRRGRPPIGRHLFRKGLLRCAHCGEAMITRSARTADGGLYETYRCYGHLLDPGSCSIPPQPREPIDSAIFAYFERAALDAEATRRELAEAVERRSAEVSELLEAASKEAEAAAAGLARVKGDYVSGQLTASEWRELRAELAPQAAAAAAERKRLQRQLAAIRAGPDVSAAEGELREQLDRIGSAIAAGVEEQAGIEAVRVALFELCECFLIHPGSPEEPQADLTGEGYWIEPVISARAVEGYEEKLRPVLISRAGPTG